MLRHATPVPAVALGISTCDRNHGADTTLGTAFTVTSTTAGAPAEVEPEDERHEQHRAGLR